MTDRRSGPPLFDLMRERGDRPDAPKPTPPPSQSQPASPPSQPRPVTAPQTVESEAGSSVSTKQTAWDSSGGVSRAERSAAAMLDGEVQDDSGIRISSPMFYTLIAVAFALILGAWTIGYQRGNAAGKKEIEPYVRDQPVIRPAQSGIESPAQTTAQTSTQTNSKPSSSGRPAETPTTTIPAGAGVMSPSGFLAQDPREPGLNYLVLGTLNTEQTADAISFMYSNSITVIGVPVVDSRGSGANNPSRYTLYSLGVAIPGNQWSAMSNERVQHQSLIADLGSRWQRERRGASDFSESKTNWEKFE